MRSERAIQPILMAQRAKIRPERAKLRPPMAKGGDGRTDGRTEGRKDGRTDVSKFPPVFYSTSALWGRCPKRPDVRPRRNAGEISNAWNNGIPDKRTDKEC